MIVFGVIKWYKQLRNTIVMTRIDNTAAVSWALKQRARRGTSCVADALIKFFSLFCLHNNITILSLHIVGEVNVLADDMSRDITMQESRLEFTEDMLTRDALWWQDCSREEICRHLLIIPSNPQLSLQPQNLLRLLESLQ